MTQEHLQANFLHAYGKSIEAIQCFFAPGRVNLIGEHTDYNGGYVFPTALSLGIYGALRLRSDHLIQLQSTNASPPVVVDLNNPISYQKQDGWANYPKGVIKYLQDQGITLRGCDILFSGNLPDGAGLSSSAALLVLTTFMLKIANGESNIDRKALALFCQKVENEFIKVNCGIMDQFSVANGLQDHALLLDCATLEYQLIPFVLKKHSLVIMNTNKRRGLTDSKYNQRRSECEQARDLIGQYRPIANLCEASLEEVETYLPEGVLKRRARHVVSENLRTLEAVNRLKAGDLLAFGRLVTTSGQSLRDDYEVTGPELDSLVAHALQTPGCIGARMTGGGFGGCAIALVANQQLTAFQTAVAEGYQRDIGLRADFYVATIADGVKQLQ